MTDFETRAMEAKQASFAMAVLPTEVKNKAFYYIVTCADDDRASQERTLECFRGYADCVEGAKEMGVVYGTGVYKPGEIKNTPAFSEAYQLGRSVR